MTEILSTEQTRLDEQAWQVFRYHSASSDRRQFEATYVGHYATRAAFGETLLRDTYGADARLQQLPSWLQGYVQLNGDAVADDFERAGHYQLLAVAEQGIYVFDGATFSKPAGAPQ